MRSSTSAAPAVHSTNQAVAPVKCSWTEHTSPDGYKYYYNSVTGESKVRNFVSQFAYLSVSVLYYQLMYLTSVCLNECIVGET